MARTDTLGNFLTDVADAMRAKTGESGTIQASDFDTIIAGITTPPTLQDKQVTITENTTTTIEADSNYDGLGTVSVTTNVSGGSAPTKGFVVDSWDSNGYPTKITTYGFTTIPSYYIGCDTTTYTTALKPSEIVLNSGVTTISSNAFYGNKSLINIEFPNTLTDIGLNAFTKVTNLAITELPANLSSLGNQAFSGTGIAIKTIPDTLTTIPNWAFNNCQNITQISMANVTTINGVGTNNGGFYNEKNLKAVWIGSAITSIGRYSFGLDTAVTKFYIDLPRASVEAMANYSYAFSNNAFSTDVIICNDDEGFLTKAEFDAIDWSAE